MNYHRNFERFKKLNEFAMIVVAIMNRKKKFQNIFIELHIQTKNK